MTRGIRLAVILCVVSAMASGCGGGGRRAVSALDDAVRLIAESQAVDESEVMAALRQFARSEDEMLDVARQWELHLPSRPLPKLVLTDPDPFVQAAREAFRSAVCDAIVDVLTNKKVFSGNDFVESYVEASVLELIPAGELFDIVLEFDDLNEDALAGTLTTADVRLTWMKMRNC